MHLSLEQKIEKINRYRPIDDIFFEVLARDIPFDQEMLRLILDDEDLIVEDVIVQSDERNLYGHSVRLDALCILGNGAKCNVEVQRSDNDNHLKRARYNASMITVKDSDTGKDYSKIPEVYVVYISEFDIFKKNKTVYHIEKVIKETGDSVDDGLHEIFVNTKIHDGTAIADYMKHFTETTFDDPKFPCLTKAVKTIKETEGGRESMCKIMEEYAKEYSREATIDAIICYALKHNVSVDQLVQELHEDYGLDSVSALKRIEELTNKTA
jgi:predicted transposase/invertase (TIGR01784 family)